MGRRQQGASQSGPGNRTWNRVKAAPSRRSISRRASTAADRRSSSTVRFRAAHNTAKREHGGGNVISRKHVTAPSHRRYVRPILTNQAPFPTRVVNVLGDQGGEAASEHPQSWVDGATHVANVTRDVLALAVAVQPKHQPLTYRHTHIYICMASNV